MSNTIEILDEIAHQFLWHVDNSEVDAQLREMLATKLRIDFTEEEWLRHQELNINEQQLIDYFKAFYKAFTDEAVDPDKKVNELQAMAQKVDEDPSTGGAD